MEVQRHCWTYASVLQQLKSLGLPYALLFLVRLKVDEEENTGFFLTPEDAWMWLHAKDLAMPPPATPQTDAWLTLRSNHQLSNKLLNRPSTDHEAREWVQAVVEVLQQSRNPFVVLQPDQASTTGCDKDNTMDYPGGEPPGSELMPHLADDLL
ncbi:hypothetical protein NDU88_001368 [Pleurodeles waltl]|uniref:Uncharacterized protein n=1 Tax=Pleurodeles waltl TaxID=8319 RepID=A0AAV7MJI7_PLEWA|nr:hypothetical protein NDU88_001368 [Pleurodeles waltl]